jgi:hypothetical protein
MPNYNTLQRTIERQRFDPASRDVDGANLLAIAIHGEYAVDKTGQR